MLIANIHTFIKMTIATCRTTYKHAQQLSTIDTTERGIINGWYQLTETCASLHVCKSKGLYISTHILLLLWSCGANCRNDRFMQFHRWMMLNWRAIYEWRSTGSMLKWTNDASLRQSKKHDTNRDWQQRCCRCRRGQFTYMQLRRLCVVVDDDNSHICSYVHCVSL